MRSVLALAAGMTLTAGLLFPPPTQPRDEALQPTATGTVLTAPEPAKVWPAPEEIVVDTVRAVIPESLAYLAPVIVGAAEEAGVDPLLVVAVIRVESGFDPDVISVHGAVGLMQVMPATAGLPTAVLLDPATNVRVGTMYLGQMVSRYGLQGGLTAYNRGPGGLERWRRLYGTAETPYSKEIYELLSREGRGR